MRRRSFPVLDAAEDELVDELRVGLDRHAARVLAYLLAREADPEWGDEPASRLAVRVGTGLGRTATDDALSTLDDRELVDRSTVENRSSGRPATEWRAAAGRATVAGRVRETHARALLDQARTVAGSFEGAAGEPAGWPGGGAGDGATAEEATGEAVSGAGEGTAGDSPAARGGDPGEGGTPTELTVALNWEPNGFHAPLFAALEEGYPDRGLAVTLTACRGSEATLDALVAGETDVALSGAASVLRARAAGRAVVPLALLYQRAPSVLYTTREAFGGPFESVEQLRGARVATPAGSETEALCRLLLSQAGVVDDVTLVDAASEERDALESGAADVVTGVATDPLDLEARGHTVDVVSLSEHFPVYGPALVVRRESLVRRERTLAGVLAGTMVGWTRAVRDPGAAAEAVAARSGRDPAAERRRFAVALERFADSEDARKRGWGWQTPEGWARLRTALGQAEVLAGA